MKTDTTTNASFEYYINHETSRSKRSYFIKVAGLLSRPYTLLKHTLHIFLGVCLKVSEN